MLTASQDARIAVLGLGYVGLPLALAFARVLPVVGFDLNTTRVLALGEARDTSGEHDADSLRDSGAHFTADPEDARLYAANVYIVAVPTPVDAQKQVDLEPLRMASRQIGAWLKRGDLVIYESTVYPGCTRDVCAPLLEAVSGLHAETDFFLGYSPERINPGDRMRPLEQIVKVTSAASPQAAQVVDALYRRIIIAGTHLAPSIEVAEAAKALENTQRDVNIALINEFAQLCGRIGLDTRAVLAAAGSKWNFLPFEPGLVGGHCIGVDPYYLIHRAQQTGYHPQLIAAARRVNDGMSEYIGGRLLDLLAQRRIAIFDARVLILGLAFKENCADLRNTRVVEIVERLLGCGARVDVHDPWVDPLACRAEYGIDLCLELEPTAYDVVLLAVAHQQYRDWSPDYVRSLLKSPHVVFDVKGIWPADLVDGRL